VHSVSLVFEPWQDRLLLAGSIDRTNKRTIFKTNILYQNGGVVYITAKVTE
jgi:hypothetical protein